MTNLTPSEARRLIDKLHHNQTKEHGISILEEKYLAALEIALTVLEQQEEPEDAEDEFVVMRKPGMVPVIKRPVGEISEYLKQLYQHNPGAVCDVITFRFAGPAGQWVSDGNELLSMLDDIKPKTDTYRQIENDAWIVWRGGSCPVGRMDFVEVRFSNKTQGSGMAHWWVWNHTGEDDDIIAYRVIENDGREG